MRSLRLPLSALVIAGLVGLTACATGGAGALAPVGTPSVSPTSSTQPSSPAPVGTSSAAPVPEEFDCDAMLRPSVSAELRAGGLTAAPKTWTQFGFQPTGPALECPWGTPSSLVPEAFYAWAELKEGDHDRFIDLVLENGYEIEDTERGAWVVTPPELEAGGRLEALITRDWVAFAGSRDGIDDIVWTQQ